MEERIRKGRSSGFLLSAFRGGIAAAGYLIGLAALAIAFGKYGALSSYQPLLARGLLLLSALLAGVLGCRRIGKGRLAHACAGELFLFLLCAVSCAVNGGKTSGAALALNLFLLLIGAFAGAIMKRKGRRIPSAMQLYRK